MDSHRDILDSIRRIVRALRVSSRAAERELGLGGAQLFVLQVLARDRALSINEIAERTHTHQSSVSAVVGRLEEAGWVKRQASKEDARRTEVSLTAKGAALLRKTPPLAQERLVAAIDSLPRGQRDELAGLLHTLVKEAGFAGEPATMFFEEEKK